MISTIGIISTISIETLFQNPLLRLLYVSNIFEKDFRIDFPIKILYTTGA